MNNVEQIYQGDGKFTWTNGDTYEGAWASDAMSGFGTTKYETAMSTLGRWHVCVSYCFVELFLFLHF